MTTRTLRLQAKAQLTLEQKLNEYIDRWISVKIYVQCFCLDSYNPTMKRSSVFILPIVILQPVVEFQDSLLLTFNS